MSGLDKNDYALILERAIPAMVMARAVLGVFEQAERKFIPAGPQRRPA